MPKYSDKQLNLPSRWFTGREWFNGTAEDYFVREFKQASAEMAIEERENDRADLRSVPPTRWTP